MNLIKTISIFVLTSCMISPIQAQKTNTETIKKQIPFAPSINKTFYVENIDGSVEVEGYNGNTIQIEVTKTIEAKTDKYLQRGIQEIGLEVVEINGNVHVYMESPYSFFDKESGDFHYQEYDHRNRKNFVKRKYDYNLNFKIKVPRKTNVDVHTINNGDIVMENLRGQTITAKNINGAITLKNVTGKTDVNALNQDIEISYAENPKEESWYNSLNGDINIKFQRDLNATISYKTMNGNLYSNFDVQKVAPVIHTQKVKKGGKVKYKVKSKEQLQIGKGGVHLHFNQLNGNATLKSK